MLALILAWADFLDFVRKPPHSLWFIFIICLLVSLSSTFVTKKLVDQEKNNRIQRVINDHNKKKKNLLKMSEENPKRYAKEYGKWSRRDASVKKMQQSMQMSRLKPSCITMLPLIVFFYLIRSIYTPVGSSVQLPVALPAMNPMDDFPGFIVNMIRSESYSALGNIIVEMGWLGYTGYYMLCSFTVSSLVQKIFKTSPGKQAGAPSMFDTTSQTELPKPGSL